MLPQTVRGEHCNVIEVLFISAYMIYGLFTGLCKGFKSPKRSLKMPSLYNHALTDQCPQICIFYQFKTGMVTYLNVQIMIP